VSPLRTLAKSIVREPQEVLGAQERMALAYLHLMEFINPVQIFHMGNGALIGDIKTDANREGTKDHHQGLNVMVNYDYSSDAQRRAHNRALFNSVLTAAREKKPLPCVDDLFHPDVLKHVERLNGHVDAMAARMAHRSGAPILAHA
jgi:hypothetical protein